MKGGRRSAATETLTDWIERELAGLKAGLQRIEDSLERAAPPAAAPPRTPERAAPAAVAAPVPLRPAPAPVGIAAARRAAAAPPPAPTPPPRPTGTDLGDPKNFGMMPPTADLERGSSSPEEYRLRLARHIEFATKVLHTSRVQAAVWRDWRAFEKTAMERLRELLGRPAEDVAEI